MVSGFFTSPCDHCRISSAVARPMRISSKKFTSSTLLVFFLYALLGCVTCPCPEPVEGFVALTGSGRVIGSSNLVHDAEGLTWASRQVDAEVLTAAVVLVGVPQLHLGAVTREHLDVQAERLHLLDQHLERLRDAGLGNVLALDDRLVNLDPARDVVGLDGEQLLQSPGRAVRLQGPHLHLAESLDAELGLTAQRL